MANFGTLFGISAPDLRLVSVSHNLAGFGLAFFLVIGFAGCKGSYLSDGVLDGTAKPSHVQSKTESSAGHFLAARQALYFNDIDQSANFFLETLRNDSDNADLLRQTFMTQYHLGKHQRGSRAWQADGAAQHLIRLQCRTSDGHCHPGPRLASGNGACRHDERTFPLAPACGINKGLGHLSPLVRVMLAVHI